MNERDNEIHNPFIAVHLGAGRHSKLKESQYTKLCRIACQVGMNMLVVSADSREVCEAVCKILEDSPLTNAGTGSNLNSQGVVECDASLIDSQSMVGTGVAALTGVKNPISVAKALGDDIIGKSDKDYHTKLGISKPAFLCGSGAYRYAMETDCELIKPEDQVISSTKKGFEKWTKMKHSLLSDSRERSEILNDTVGVICGDKCGNISICSSSGGNSLKQPGRIGPAALIGTGTAIKKQNKGSSKKIIACCSTGHGDDIITIKLSNLVCDTLLSTSDNEDELINNLFKSLPNQFPYLQANPLYLGFLGILYDYDSFKNGANILLNFAHTTESMIVGYASSVKPMPTVIKSYNHRVGAVCVGGTLLS